MGPFRGGHTPTLKTFSHWRGFRSAASDWSVGVASENGREGYLWRELPGGQRERAPGVGTRELTTAQ